MKKVGKEVLWLSCSDENPRNGEGAFIRLKDGKIVHAFTEYIGEDWHDHASARITYVVSADEGETWSERIVLMEKPVNSKNLMSLSLLRMGNGDIGLFYILKNADGTDTICLIRSSDEFQTWSEPLDCFKDVVKPDYYVLNNDRVLMTQTGRLVMPLAVHPLPHDTFTSGTVLFLVSDDDGRTWRKIDQELVRPVATDSYGFQEPGLYQFEDGTIWCYIRTGMGCQWESFSTDNGETWSPAIPNLLFTSPASPMLVKKIHGRTLAIFNPIPNYTTRDQGGTWGRTPYVIAVSDDDGKTWDKEKFFCVEDDPENGYCYPAVIEVEGGLLLSYYHSDNTGWCLRCSRITKIAMDELA